VEIETEALFEGLSAASSAKLDLAERAVEEAALAPPPD